MLLIYPSGHQMIWASEHKCHKIRGWIGTFWKPCQNAGRLWEHMQSLDFWMPFFQSKYFPGGLWAAWCLSQTWPGWAECDSKAAGSLPDRLKEIKQVQSFLQRSEPHPEKCWTHSNAGPSLYKCIPNPVLHTYTTLWFRRWKLVPDRFLASRPSQCMWSQETKCRQLHCKPPIPLDSQQHSQRTIIAKAPNVCFSFKWCKLVKPRHFIVTTMTWHPLLVGNWVDPRDTILRFLE